MNALANSANTTGPGVGWQTPSGGVNVKVAGLLVAIFLSLLSAARAQEPTAECKRDVDRAETRFHYYIQFDAHHTILAVGASAIPNAQDAPTPANGIVTPSPPPIPRAGPQHYYPSSNIELPQLNPSLVEALLVKFVEWEKIAREHDVEAFDKPIGKIGEDPQAKAVVFRWTGQKDKRARAVFPEMNGRMGGAISVEDAQVFLSLLREDLPPLYKTFTEKLAKRDREAELFK